MKKILILVLILFISAFMLIGCTSLTKKNKAWQTVIPKKTSFIHMVQWPNETLPIIAKWYTGDSNTWQSLADANPVINPKQLSAGNKIFIPKDLLKIRKPMPRKFIAEYYDKLKKKKLPSKSVKVPKKQAPVPSQPAPLPEEEDQFDIIGPK
jgi:hypothetical protein